MPLNKAPIQAKPINDKTGYTNTVWVKWYASIVRLLARIRNNGTIEPVTLTDAQAENNSIYYSSDQAKLVYKDSGGTVNGLY